LQDRIAIPLPREAHVWTLDLDLAPQDTLESLASLLSADEQFRASRLAFAVDRRRFIVCRAMLRRAIGGYLGVEPASLRFELNPWNKPYLAGGENLRFNVSHSGGTALFVFTTGVEAGIDIEHINSRIGVFEVAAHCFSDDEQAALLTVPDAELQAAFFACWSRKEAYIKARGMGLSLDLRSFDVSINPQEERWTLREHGTDVSADWTLLSFSAAPETASALAVPAPAFSARHFRWDWAQEAACLSAQESSTYRT